MRKGKTEKKHTRTRGKRCTTWHKNDLINIIVNHIKLAVPEDNKYKYMPKKKLVEDCKKEKSIISALGDDLNKYSEEDLIRALYYNKLSLDQNCENIQNWFEQNDLLMNDPSCGVQGRSAI